MWSKDLLLIINTTMCLSLSETVAIRFSGLSKGATTLSAMPRGRMGDYSAEGIQEIIWGCPELAGVSPKMHVESAALSVLLAIRKSSVSPIMPSTAIAFA